MKTVKLTPSRISQLSRISLISLIGLFRMSERESCVCEEGESECFQPNLKCCLLIFKALIRLSSVDGGTRSLAAAPDGPETRPLVSRSAASITSRSLPRSMSKTGDVSTRTARGGVLLESHNSSTEKTSAELRIMDLSITFCNSRILPGQS